MDAGRLVEENRREVRDRAVADIADRHRVGPRFRGRDTSAKLL